MLPRLSLCVPDVSSSLRLSHVAFTVETDTIEPADYRPRHPFIYIFIKFVYDYSVETESLQGACSRDGASLFSFLWRTSVQSQQCERDIVTAAS